MKALLVVVGIALVLRLALVLTHDGYLGVDGGAYLLSRNDVLGVDSSGVTGSGLPRPPLAPGWLMVPFTSALGDDVGFKVFSALGSLAPIFAVYLLSQSFLSRRQALLPAGLIALDIWQAEMLVTGVMPLLGFSLIVTCIWSVAALARRWQWRSATVLAGALPLVAYVNQTSAGMTVVVLGFYTVSLFFITDWGRRDWTILRRLAVPAAVGGLLALTALPWYLPHLPGSERVHYPGPWIYPSSWTDSAWIQFIIAVPIGVFIYRKALVFEVRALGALVIFVAALAPWLSYDETIINLFFRSRYLLMMLAVPAASYIVFHYWQPVPFHKQLVVQRFCIDG